MSGIPKGSWRGDLLDCGVHAAMYCGVFCRTVEHRHYAIQLFECRDGATVRIGERVHTEVTTALIGSGVSHELMSGGTGSFLFVAPHAAYGRRLRSLLPPGAGDVGALVVTAADARGGSSNRWLPQQQVTVSATADSIVSWLGERVRTKPQATVQMAEVCTAFNRSDAAVSRILRVDLGVNFSSIVRWERLRLAIEVIAEGASCTHAAHEAGFYDGAHFTRVCKAMFGIPPKLLELGCVRPAATKDVAATFSLRDVG